VSSHVRFRSGGEDYALSAADVREVDEIGEVAILPGAPAGVIGVRNVHGRVVPVLDLAQLLGIGGPESPGRIVIAEDSGRRAALAVEAVVGVEDIGDAGEEAQSPLLSGAALVDGVLIGILDLPALLDSVQGERPG
jgi:chemotaxis signal transduction protein